jgi:hypothetical protein
MKIQALLFMCNDFDRAKFTLENFSKHNSEIDIVVINSGGDSPKLHLQHIAQIVEFIDTEDLWHRKTWCGRGGFGLKYIDILFKYGLNNKYTHTLYLETDVLTNNKIVIEPKYDLAGLFVGCGPKERFLWNYMNIQDYHYHTGCGGTIFSYNFFNTIYNNSSKFNLFQELYDKFPEHYYIDLIITLIARVSDVTCGEWEEISDVRGNIINGKLQKNLSATLVHGYKV